MPRQTAGVPRITGATVDEIRQSTQFWLERVYDQIDQLSGLRGTPTFYGDIDANGRRITNVGTPQGLRDAVPNESALTKISDPITGTQRWNAESLQILNVQAASDLDQGVNLSQLREEIAANRGGEAPAGIIALWSGSIATIPVTWRLCDGTGGTPDLRDRFIVGSGSTYAVGATGGASTINIAHTHTADGTLAAASAGAHTHTAGTLVVGAPSGTTPVDNNLDLSSVSVADATHTHTVSGATASDGAHTHDVTGDTSSSLSATQSILPLYYSLCYIMKL